MKRVIRGAIFASSIGSRYSKVKKVFRDVSKAWKAHANLDVEVADDGRSITYPDSQGSSINQRVDIRMIPEYHLYNSLQDEVLVTTNLSELENTISDLIKEDIK